jgi:hypothetical protein
MRRLSLHIISIVLLFGVAACAESTEPSGGDTAVTDSGSDAGTSEDAATADVPACEIEPTLASLNENYFSKSCTFGSCHSASKAGGLDLTGDIHAALVNVPAVFAGAAANGKILVVPGDPDNSYFLQKLEGPDAGEGGIMPLGAQEPMDPACRIKMVRQWIADGANP